LTSSIISPFDQEMLQGSPGTTRNLLVNYIRSNYSSDDLNDLKLADFGCGPGNLLIALGDIVKNYIAVDRSEHALRLAEEKAVERGISFTPVRADMLDLNEANRYEVIVSVNSIILDNRQKIQESFNKVRKCLTTQGRFIAILPAFEAVDHLHELWYRYYVDLTGDPQYAARIKSALQLTKRYDAAQKRYADDCNSTQCYHTEQTIQAEFALARLRIVERPKKVYYPWDLSRKFDYGYFPKEEEIWDWFVVAERSP
jgi:ubiquinone/menaquinone biosynthesis C-methylase UbiE